MAVVHIPRVVPQGKHEPSNIDSGPPLGELKGVLDQLDGHQVAAKGTHDGAEYGEVFRVTADFRVRRQLSDCRVVSQTIPRTLERLTTYRVLPYAESVGSEKESLVLLP